MLDYLDLTLAPAKYKVEVTATPVIFHSNNLCVVNQVERMLLHFKKRPNNAVDTLQFSIAIEELFAALH